jgi:O-antigen/teichoic acid export membrane protein
MLYGINALKSNVISNMFFKKLTIEQKNLVIIFISRFLLFLSSYASVSVLLNILDKNAYGVWLTLVGTLNWILYFDFGIGNSLKNYITVFLVENNVGKIKNLISQTYFSSIVISFLLFIVGLLSFLLFDFTRVFNTTMLRSELNISIVILIISFCLQIVVKNIVSILHSFQRVGIAEILSASSSILFIIILLVAVPKNVSLPVLATIYGVTQLIIFCIYSIVYFKKNPTYTPEILLSKVSFDRKMLNLGLDFFIIQMAGMVLYSTDSYLISYLISPSEVPQYHVVMKYFNIIILGFGMFLAPVWPMVSKKYAEKDLVWIKNKVNLSLIHI